MFDPIVLNAEDFSVEYELKSLPSEELLDIWQQTQEMEYKLKSELGRNIFFSINLEKIIIHVLQTRSVNPIIPPLTTLKPKKSKPAK